MEGLTLEMNIQNERTVRELKERIQDLHGTPSGCQVLCQEGEGREGAPLPDELVIRDECTVTLQKKDYTGTHPMRSSSSLQLQFLILYECQ